MAHIREVQRKGGRGVAFEVRWREHGADRQKTLPTRRAAERHALKVEDKLERSGNSDGLYERRETVAEVVEKVMANAERKLKPRTLHSYRLIYDARILPEFGRRRVATVTSQDVEAWISELSKSGLAPATVRHCHIALSKAMKYALRHRMISVNPCVGTDLPTLRRDNEHAVFLRPEQVEAIASALADSSPYDLLVRFAAWTGLRAGEIAGLRVRDVNLLKRELRVERTLQKIGGEWVAGSPKSARSTRTVPLLSAGLVKDLAAYLEQHPRRANPDALLWPGRQKGGHHAVDWSRPFNQGSFYRWHWRPALVRAGLLGQILPTDEGTWLAVCGKHDDPPEYHTEPEAVRHVANHAKGGVRFHDLRHTAASSWLASGVDLFKVSRWMGHGTISVTADVYSHLLPGDHSSEAAQFEAWLSKAQ
jgi:integrase